MRKQNIQKHRTDHSPMTNKFLSTPLLICLIAALSACGSITVVDDNMIVTFKNEKCNSFLQFSNANEEQGVKQLTKLRKQIVSLQELDEDEISISDTQRAELSNTLEKIDTLLTPYQQYQIHLEAFNDEVRDIMAANPKGSYPHLETVSIETSLGIINKDISLYYQQKPSLRDETKELLAAVNRINGSVNDLKAYASRMKPDGKKAKMEQYTNDLHLHWVHVKKYIASVYKIFAQANKGCSA